MDHKIDAFFTPLESRLSRLEHNRNVKLSSTLMSCEVKKENYNSGSPVIKVPTFDGQSSWSSFKTQFNVVAQINGWNVGDKASYLAAALRGPAVEVLQMIPEQLRLDFNSLVNALGSRYEEEHYQQLYVKFKNNLQDE
ncbi:hypothetical protein LAZ67_13001056 [Cordylochernes scorpioides]|uniref:Uncharacterized protein n=1 Tax=Cordylochernes scorpioides TaxID=51811 RepID=A0ABY6L3I3_9ARAC|nr:hypothetical protein LAZ67_13001056 [Cordylochernes scorpioides]